mgnify:CR=1 FL=1
MHVEALQLQFIFVPETGRTKVTPDMLHQVIPLMAEDGTEINQRDLHLQAEYRHYQNNYRSLSGEGKPSWGVKAGSLSGQIF